MLTSVGLLFHSGYQTNPSLSLKSHLNGNATKFGAPREGISAGQDLAGASYLSDIDLNGGVTQLPPEV